MKTTDKEDRFFLYSLMTLGAAFGMTLMAFFWAAAAHEYWIMFATAGFTLINLAALRRASEETRKETDRLIAAFPELRDRHDRPEA